MTMKRSEALQILSSPEEVLSQMGVETLAIFGSAARDMAQEDSDIDVLVELWGACYL